MGMDIQHSLDPLKLEKKEDEESPLPFQSERDASSIGRGKVFLLPGAGHQDAKADA